MAVGVTAHGRHRRGSCVAMTMIGGSPNSPQSLSTSLFTARECDPNCVPHACGSDEQHCPLPQRVQRHERRRSACGLSLHYLGHLD
jgi:hypothetical protein